MFYLLICIKRDGVAEKWQSNMNKMRRDEI